MAERHDIESRVKRVVASQLGVVNGSVSSASLLSEDLGADVLDRVELIMALEDEFDITIPDEYTEGLASVGDLVRHVELAVE